MTNTITRFDHQDGGRKRASGRRVIALAGALIAFGTLFSSGADAGGYSQRDRAAPLGYAYNTQANPNYGFGPLVAGSLQNSGLPTLQLGFLPESGRLLQAIVA